MAEIDITLIAQRLIHLRKHLGERQSTSLTIPEVAQQAGIPAHKMIRLEHGRGTAESLLTLLYFYRLQGYNLDWVLFPDNTHVPLILSSGDDLLQIGELVQRLSQRLQGDYQEITTRLRSLGYSPLDDKPFAPASPETDAPEAFDFSS